MTGREWSWKVLKSASETMTKTAVRLAALVGFAIALQGQSAPQDIAGWDKLKWGMTMAEARAAYKVDAQPEANDDWTLLKLHPVNIGGVELGVQAGARHGSEKITLVTLWSYFGLTTSAPTAGPQDFDTLKTILIQKYGQPANEEVKRGLNFRSIKTVQWKFPSTSILMTLEQSASLPHLGNLTIDYTASDKSTDKPQTAP
jgi:hypothetical protein